MNTMENVMTQDPRGLLTMEVATENGIVKGLVDVGDVFLMLSAIGAQVITPWGTFTPTRENLLPN